jgi:hypothetical protein
MQIKLLNIKLIYLYIYIGFNYIFTLFFSYNSLCNHIIKKLKLEIIRVK